MIVVRCLLLLSFYCFLFPLNIFEFSTLDKLTLYLHIGLDITLHTAIKSIDFCFYMMMGSRGNGGAVVVGRLFRRMISTTADSTKKNIMLSPITTATTTATTTRRNFVSATNIVLEKHTMKVPSMGDSITEVRA